MAFPKGKRRIGCLGEDDAKEKEKFQCVGIDYETDADCITSVSDKEFSVTHCLRLQQKVEAAAASSMPLGSFQQRAIASAMALHSMPNKDLKSVPIYQPQAQAQAQGQSVSQLQSGKKAMLKQHQSHYLQNQFLQQHVLRQKQLSNQEQQQQLQQLPYHLFQQQQPKKQQFQQQHLQRLLQQQNTGVPDYIGSLIERSSKSSPASIVIPNTFESTQGYCADTDILKSFSAAASSLYPLKNGYILPPQSSGSLISDTADDHVSSLLSNYTEAYPSESIILSGVSVPESELQGASCLRALTAAETPHTIPYSLPVSTFSSKWIQQADLLGISSLPKLQINSTMHSCSAVTDQNQTQPELVLPSTVSPAAPAVVSVDESDSTEMVTNLLNQLPPQNYSAYGNYSGHGSLAGNHPISGCYSASPSDPFTSLNAGLSGTVSHGAGNHHQNLPVASSKPPTRSYTKIYKAGSISRAVDVNRFKDYTELRCELAQMFGLEGRLEAKSGWQLVFIDNENDILLVGDDPWEVFVSTVRGIWILSPSEVAYYMSSEEKVAAPNNCLDSSVTRRF